jgi:hypothetical protein
LLSLGGLSANSPVPLSLVMAGWDALMALKSGFNHFLRF